MKNLNGFNVVNERVLSLSDAFCDYMNDNYHEGAVEDMDSETVEFEFENFCNAYAK
jgi:hypothetical protein